jgi:hypothetical protein
MLRGARPRAFSKRQELVWLANALLHCEMSAVSLWPAAARELTAGAAHRRRPRRIAEIHARALNDSSRFVDDEAKVSLLVEESQPIAARVLIHAALAQARDLSVPHHGVNQRRLELQTLSDDRCLDVYGVILNL